MKGVNVKTQVFVYKGVLGIQSSPQSVGLLNKPMEKDQLGFVMDASKVEFQQMAIDWLSKVPRSSDCIGNVDVFKANDGMVVFSWFGGPLQMMENPKDHSGSRDYKPELLEPTEGVEAPEDFKARIDKKRKLKPQQAKQIFIYIYKNVYSNYLNGYFYFVAKNIKEARKYVREFEKKHHDDRDAYRVELQLVKKMLIKQGYFPLNRS